MEFSSIWTYYSLDMFGIVSWCLIPNFGEQHLFPYLVVFVQGVQMQDIPKFIPVINAKFRTWKLLVHGGDCFLQTLRRKSQTLEYLRQYNFTNLLALTCIPAHGRGLALYILRSFPNYTMMLWFFLDVILNFWMAVINNKLTLRICTLVVQFCLITADRWENN